MTTETVQWFAGMPIRKRGNMMCVTDMQRATKTDTSLAQWMETDHGKEFVTHIASTTSDALLDIGPTHTWAHWQIAMAYGQDISPAFMIWSINTLLEKKSPDELMREFYAKAGKSPPS